MNIKILLSISAALLMSALIQGCASSDLTEQKLENCEPLNSSQEKIDCRMRNKKALDDFDKDNRRDPLYRPR